MLAKMINGFCMALADSVPGVSGGTIAFIMGFYDRFIGSIHDLVFGKGSERKTAFLYLVKLGIGWVIGMGLAVLILASLFESHIYVVSSLFIGFIIGALPIIIVEEKDSIRGKYGNIVFLILGLVLVCLITYLNGLNESSAMNLAKFSLGTSIKLFFIGMIAISAMFLPGISGSTLLLIFGAYIPVISAIKEILHFHLNYVPSIMFFGFGVICGAITVVKLIQLCLEKFRSQTIYCILGMLIGSLYAVVMGPTTLEIPHVALSIKTFNILACVIGLALVLGMQYAKTKQSKK